MTSISDVSSVPASVARQPWTVRAANLLTIAAAGLLLVGMIIELAGGASATTIGWPVVWSASMVFHVTMARRGRQWGRVMLAIQAALTWALATQLIFTEPSPLDFVSRPDFVVGLTLASAILQTAGAAACFLPPSNAYTRQRRASARLMSPRLRKAVLTAHIIGSLAWTGILALQSTLSAVGLSTEDPKTLLALFQAQQFVENLFLGKAAFIALFTGLALALGSRWQLMHHRWVLTKLVLTLIVMILPIIIYIPSAERGYTLALEGKTPEEVEAALGFWGHLSALHLSPLMLLVAAVLSTYKPKGLTRFGQRARELAGRGGPRSGAGPSTVPVGGRPR